MRYAVWISQTLLFGGLLFALGCGEPMGGEDGGTSDTATSPDTNMPPPPGTTVAELELQETAGAATEEVVWTFGQPFVPGVVADSLVAELAGVGLPTQVDVKRRHPDGSVRHAVVSIRVPAQSASARGALSLVTAPSTTGETGAELSALLAEGFNATVEIDDGGQTYRIDAASALMAESSRWLDGPLVTELRARGVPTTAAGAPHPSMFVLFDVRFFGPDDARVSVTVENSMHDAPGNRNYTVRLVRADGSIELERAGVEHTYHARWRHVFWHGREAPTLFVRPDLEQLIGTSAIPHYDPARNPSEEDIGRLISRHEGSDRDILENGIITAYMPQTGGRGDIGPLPDWTAIALITGDARAHRIMLETGDAAGSFPVHYRDRATGRAIDIEDWPTISLHPGSNRNSRPEDKLPDCTSCDSPYTPDDAHQPSLVFVPYLLTGDPYYLEELHFWVSWNWIFQNFEYRGRAEGLNHARTARGQAWMLRTLAHAAWVLPDDEPEMGAYDQRLRNNLAWYAANAVDSNPLGWWGSQSNSPSGGRPDDNMSSDVARYTSPWQSDFLIWTMNLIVELGWEEAAVTRDWLAGFVIGRFTNDDVFNPYDGAPYHLAVIANDERTYDTWADMYVNSFAGRSGPAPTQLGNGSCTFCYPFIARTALAVAVRAGLAGAETGYTFVESELSPDDYLDRDPTWAIVP